MSAPARCPDVQRLESLLQDSLSPPDQSALTEHVGDCAACQQALDRLAAGPTREALQRAGNTLSDAEEERLKAPIREQFERQGHPYYASARLWDDGVIDPLDTRRVLGLALALTKSQDTASTRYGVFRM